MDAAADLHAVPWCQHNADVAGRANATKLESFDELPGDFGDLAGEGLSLPTPAFNKFKKELGRGGAAAVRQRSSHESSLRRCKTSVDLGLATLDPTKPISVVAEAAPDAPCKLVLQRMVALFGLSDILEGEQWLGLDRRRRRLVDWWRPG